jgi:hypothetical protein
MPTFVGMTVGADRLSIFRAPGITNVAGLYRAKSLAFIHSPAACRNGGSSAAA